MAVNRLNVGATNQLLAKASTGQSTNILELQGTAGTTLAGVDASGNPVGSLAHPPTFKNMIINGAMQVAQRSSSVASISSTGGTYNTADRQQMYIDTAGTWTQSVENDAPTGSGFRKSLKMLCTTANASLSAGSLLQVRQWIEGQNLQQVKKGTASAEQLTLSFWVKSNVTGTYIVSPFDNDNTRIVSKSYTINASDVWEYKTITFPADTTGVFDNDNGGSLLIRFILAAGTTYTSGTLQTTWGTNTAANAAVGQTNLAAATNNYWQITGVQLEVGSVATDYEFKPFDVELAQCQRYYEKTYNQGVNPGTNTAVGICGAANGANTTGYCIQTTSFKVTKRGAPVVNIYDTAGNLGKITTYVVDGTGTTNKSATVDEASQSGFRVYENGTNKNGFFWHYTADAEI